MVSTRRTHAHSSTHVAHTRRHAASHTTATHHKAKAATHTHHRKPKHKFGSGILSNLEVYAFWTGFASTIISLIQVMVLAVK